MNIQLIKEMLIIQGKIVKNLYLLLRQTIARNLKKCVGPSTELRALHSELRKGYAVIS